MDLVNKLKDSIAEEISKHGQKKIDDYIKTLKEESDKKIAAIEAELRGDLSTIVTKVAHEIKIITQQQTSGTINPTIKIEVSL